MIAKRQNQTDNYYSKLCEIYKLEPDNSALNIYLAEHYFYKKDYERAKKLIARGLQTIDSQILISKPEKRSPPIRIDMMTIKSKYYYMTAFMHHDEDDKLETAFKFYKLAVEINPANAEAHFGLGQIMLAHKNYQGAIESFETIVNNRPEFDCSDCFRVDLSYPDYGVHLLQT